MAKFTKEQYLLVEENYNLVYFAVNKILSSGYYSLQDDYDDLVQIGAYALCKSALSYDSNKGAFSTYATTSIINALRKYAEKSNGSFTTYTCENLDYSEEDEPTVEQRFFDVISPYRFELDYESELTSKLIDIAETYTGIAKYGVYCIIYISQGYSVSEIAEKYHTTINNITAWISRARMKLKNHPEILAFVA